MIWFCYRLDPLSSADFSRDTYPGFEVGACHPFDLPKRFVAQERGEGQKILGKQQIPPITKTVIR